MEQKKYQEYIAILHEELIPALGCTEPIAIAYASATAVELLKTQPQNLRVICSGNIIKNVKGVVVPASGGLRGVEAAAVLGAVGGQAEQKLEVLRGITDQHRAQTKRLLDQKICAVELWEGSEKLFIRVEAVADGQSAVVEIAGSHTNIVRKELNGEILFASDSIELKSEPFTDRACLNLTDIIQFADTVPLEDVREILEQQVMLNSAISQEGLSRSYGVNVGSTLLECNGDDVKTRAKAAAAAGSDARMSGCIMPVVINSGSGNQGLTVSMPVITYADALGVSREKLLRALLVSNLTAIHQKTRIGRLSAYCGAVSAACGSGVGIAYLHDATLEEMENTVVNTLANVAGIVCDGAKPSCAAKIASSVDASILAFDMARRARSFGEGEGLVKADVERTIDSIGRMAADGMAQTDREILKIMLEA